MADVIQITAASDGTYLIAEVMMGGMAPPVLSTARNGAELAAKVRDIFEGPVADVPLMIEDAFARDSVAAANSIMALLTGGIMGPVVDDDDDDEPVAVNEPLDPQWFPIF